MSHIRIFDTTLRDGEQSPGFSMNTDEKIRKAHQLAALGVDIIEAGFPIASKGDLEAVMAVSREVREVPIGACTERRHPGSSGGSETCKVPSHARFPGDIRPAPAGKASHDTRAGARSHRLDGQAGAKARGRR